MNFSKRPTSPLPNKQVTPAKSVETLRIRPALRRSGNLLLDMPIAARLTMGFLVAGLIATLTASIIGVQRADSLSRQTTFYQSLLQTNTTLTTGENFLQLMNTQIHTTLSDASAPIPSKETLALDQNAAHNLTNRYDTILANYVSHTLLKYHPEQATLLSEAGHTIQEVQQQSLAGSARRTWQVYQKAQNEVLLDIAAGRLVEAQHLERTQGEPTYADASSALRALIQFDQRLASSIQDAANVEQQAQLLTTLFGSILAFICIAVVGLVISNTIIRRLRQLSRVTQAVERGQMDARIKVIGRDEIAGVSASVNAMLEAILGLLQETHEQKDALTNAAMHLFSTLQVVSAGDLRMNRAASDDPIGILADAFNFTMGRFRRLILRTQGMVEHLDIIAQQELEHSEAFAHIISNYNVDALNRATPPPSTKHRSPSGELTRSDTLDNARDTTIAQMRQARTHLQQLRTSGFVQQIQTTLPQVEQAAITLKELGNLLSTEQGTRSNSFTRHFTSQQVQVLNTVSASLSHTADELRNMQHGIGKETSEFDTELKRLATSLNTLQSKITSLSATNTTTGQTQEILRAGTRFTQEINSLAHQVIGLTRELHASMTSFQFEDIGVEHSDSDGSGVKHPNIPPISPRTPKNTQPRKGRSGNDFSV
jgi:HAMP domain-containing protein/archaellum component FlaC